MNRSLEISKVTHARLVQRVFDLEPEVPGSILTGGNILPLENLEYIEVFNEPLAMSMLRVSVCKQIQSQG